MAYERLAGPLGGRRGDIQAALVSATVVNTNRGKKSHRAKVEHFLPKWDKQRRQTQTPEEQLAAVKRLNAHMGGNVNQQPSGGD